VAAATAAAISLIRISVATAMKRSARVKFFELLMLCVCTASFSPFAQAKTGSQALTQMTPHDRLYAVAFGGDVGVAVGHAGLIMETTDGGKTWSKAAEQPPTKLAMHGIAVVGNRSIAVGQKGLVLIREGRGAWRKVESGTEARLLRVGLNKNGVAIVVGAFGTLLKSTDGGETWASIAPNWAELYKSGDGSDEFSAVRDEPTNYVVKVFDDNSILIGGEYGQINHSTDGGATWTPVFQAATDASGTIPPTIFGMNVGDDGVGYASGQDGLITKTTDGGKSWKRVDSGSLASLFDIDTTADGRVIAIGMRAALVSSDAGATWQPLKALDVSLNWYSGLSRGSSTPGDELFAVGHSGRVLSLALGNR